MDVYLLFHVHHAQNPNAVHTLDGEVPIDEQAGDDVKLLGCYSTQERAHERTLRARFLPGFAAEPECFIVSRYDVDRDEWSEGYVTS